MTEKKIHIIALDVPFPADYGGVIDIFYRLKAIQSLGYSIILHAFTYGRGRPKELEEFCSEVYFYERKVSVWDTLYRRPFIVQSRKSEDLLERLLIDDYPILIEGLHCCWVLENAEIQNRTTFVRAHNIEHDYYTALNHQTSGLKKIFFGFEARKLRKYEAILAKASCILAIKPEEKEHFEKINPNTQLLPASLPELPIPQAFQPQDYCLFHGNLSVTENEEAASWLLKKVIPKIKEIPFKIAGKNPSKALLNLAKSQGVELIANPSDEEMNELIGDAKIHVLPSTQPTGLKLKLLSALQSIGTTIVNSNMIQGTDLGKFCLVANTPEEFSQLIIQEFDKKIDVQAKLITIHRFSKKYNTKDNILRVFEGRI